MVYIRRYPIITILAINQPPDYILQKCMCCQYYELILNGFILPYKFMEIGAFSGLDPLTGERNLRFITTLSSPTLKSRTENEKDKRNSLVDLSLTLRKKKLRTCWLFFSFSRAIKEGHISSNLFRCFIYNQGLSAGVLPFFFTPLYYVL